MNIPEFKNLLWDNTRKMNDVVNYSLNHCASLYGLSGMQLRILLEIGQNGSHTVGSLANNVLIAGANISSMCKKLESMGMLTRIRDREDERVVKIYLTPQSKSIIEEVNDYYEKKFIKAIGEGLIENLDAIIAAIEKVNELFIKINREEG